MQLYNGRRGRSGPMARQASPRAELEPAGPALAPDDAVVTVSGTLGARIRHERQAAGSPSGSSRPSSTYRRASSRRSARPRHTVRCDAVGDRDGLGLPVGDLFTDTEAALGTTASSTPVQAGRTRTAITLAGGVRWERLTSAPDPEVDFVYVVYPVGSESCPPDALSQHGGKEYGYVISGQLGVQIGFDEYALRAGDSVSFESHRPHRLWAIGDEPAVAVWTVLNRKGDDRAAPLH